MTRHLARTWLHFPPGIAPIFSSTTNIYLPPNIKMKMEIGSIITLLNSTLLTKKDFTGVKKMDFMLTYNLILNMPTVMKLLAVAHGIVQLTILN
jgi:hypothetical protein